jgi:ferredoxin-NADP reductase
MRIADLGLRILPTLAAPARTAAGVPQRHSTWYLWCEVAMAEDGSQVAGTPPAVPSSGRVPIEATIERVEEHSADTRSLFLRLPHQRPFTFVPGQFISLQLAGGDETLIRPYSIASDPEAAAVVEICLNLVPGGLGSRYLFDRRAGDVLRLTGPWGTFTIADPPAAEVVFIADATGIAPIRPMLRRVLARSGDWPVRLHHRAPSAGALLYRSEFETLARRHERFTFDPLIAPGAAALGEFVAARYIAGDTDRSRCFYICGVGDIVTQLRDRLRGAGYARRAVQYEKW